MCSERVVMVMCGHCRYGRGMGVRGRLGMDVSVTHLSALAASLSLVAMVVWTWMWAEGGDGGPVVQKCQRDGCGCILTCVPPPCAHLHVLSSSPWLRVAYIVVVELWRMLSVCVWCEISLAAIPQVPLVNKLV